MINQLERHDLLTGEPRYIEDEIRNAKFSMIFAALAGLLLLVSLVLTIIMWFIDGKNLITWHAIFTLIALIFAFVCVFWALDSGKKIAVGNPSSLGLTLVAFLGSIMFSIYFLTAALGIVFFRYMHFCRLLGWYAVKSTWNDRMIDSLSFEDGWWWNSVMLFWIGFIAVVVGIIFAFIAYSAWSITYNRFKMGRYAFYLACIFMIINGWMVIYWGEEIFEWETYPALAGYGSSAISRGLWIFGIASIILGLVGLIINFLKLGKGYFVLATIAIVLFILVLVFNGFNLRALYTEETESTMDKKCGENLAVIHQDETSQWCPNKYTPNTCRKQDLTTKWEVTPNVTASLNPSCCKCTKQFYLWPYFMLGLFAMALALWLFVFLAAGFYLSENVENYGAAKMTDSLDAVFVVIGILALLAFGLYFLLRSSNTVVRTQPGALNYANPTTNPDADFTLVKDSVKKNAVVINDGTVPWDANNQGLPSFSKNNVNCNDPAKCIMRFAVLSKNAQINVNNKSAVAGNANSRLEFFPGCTSSSNKYVFFFGNEVEIQNTVKSITFTPNNAASPGVHAAYYLD